jgi:hypothetical protein
MLAQFGGLFEGRQRGQSERRARRVAGHFPGTTRRHAGADGDQPNPRIRRRPGSAQLSGDPLGLVSALGKLDNAAVENPPAQQNTATAPLFIVNPLSGARMDNLFATHPSTENRIAALEELAGARAA